MPALIQPFRSFDMGEIGLGDVNVRWTATYVELHDDSVSGIHPFNHKQNRISNHSHTDKSASGTV